MAGPWQSVEYGQLTKQLRVSLDGAIGSDCVINTSHRPVIRLDQTRVVVQLERPAGRGEVGSNDCPKTNTRLNARPPSRT